MNQGVSIEQVNSILRSYGGSVIGYTSIIDEFTLQVPISTMEALLGMAEYLMDNYPHLFYYIDLYIGFVDGLALYNDAVESANVIGDMPYAGTYVAHRGYTVLFPEGFSSSLNRTSSTCNNSTRPNLYAYQLYSYNTPLSHGSKSRLGSSDNFSYQRSIVGVYAPHNGTYVRHIPTNTTRCDTFSDISLSATVFSADSVCELHVYLQHYLHYGNNTSLAYVPKHRLGVSSYSYYEHSNIYRYSTYGLSLLYSPYHTFVSLNTSNPTSDPWWTNNEWGLTAMNVPDVWRLYGNVIVPIPVGIVDSGINNNHNDLRIPSSNVNTNHGHLNHGTPVIGIIGAEHNNGTGLAGVVNLPRNYLFSYDAHTRLAGITARQMRVGLAWNVNNGARVVNFSLAAENVLREGALRTAMERLLRAGHDFLIIQASGNQSRNVAFYAGWPRISSTDFPALYNRIIVVGSINPSGAVADHSNYGSRVDVLAPGEGIYIPLNHIRDYQNNNVQGNPVSDTGWVNAVYGFGVGTSFAAPHVAGVAALVWGANPYLTAPEVKEIIIETSRTPDRQVRDNRGGNSNYGNSYFVVDALAAVREARLRYVGGWLRGYVFSDTTGNLISGANVELLYHGETVEERITSSNPDIYGVFIFQINSSTSGYSVRISAENYHDLQITVPSVAFREVLALEIVMNRIEHPMPAPLNAIIVVGESRVFTPAQFQTSLDIALRIVNEGLHPVDTVGLSTYSWATRRHASHIFGNNYFGQVVTLLGSLPQNPLDDGDHPPALFHSLFSTALDTIINNAPAEQNRVIIFVSRGYDGMGLPNSTPSLWNLLIDNNITVHTVGVANYDEQLLRAMAGWGGGYFFTIETLDQLIELLQTRTPQAQQRTIVPAMTDHEINALIEFVETYIEVINMYP